jgi:hypothetical protein
MEHQKQTNANEASSQNNRNTHVLFLGNPRVIIASREAIGAMKYKGE